MTLRTVALCVCLVGAADVAHTQVPVNSNDPTPSLKTVHFFNLTWDAEETFLVEALQLLNSAIEEAGYPDAGYRLWKVSTWREGRYAYLMEGIWPDQATYDTIHASSAWLAAQERVQPVMGQIVEQEVYDRFRAIPLVGREVPKEVGEEMLRR